MKKIIKYYPFISSLLYALYFSILFIGRSKGIEWFDTSKGLIPDYFRYLVDYTLDNYGYFMYIPLINLIILVCIKLFKYEVFLFYLTLILIIINNVIVFYAYSILNHWG